MRHLPQGPDNVQTDQRLIDEQKEHLKEKFHLKDENLKEDQWAELLEPEDIDVRGGAVMYIYEKQGVNATATVPQLPAVDANAYRVDYLGKLFEKRVNASLHFKKSLLQIMKDDKEKERFTEQIKTLREETQNAGQAELTNILKLASMEPIMHGAHVEQTRLGIEGATTVLGILLNGDIIPMQVPGEEKGSLVSNTKAEKGVSIDSEIEKKVAEYQPLAVKADLTKKEHKKNLIDYNTKLGIPIDDKFIKAQLDELDEVKEARKSNPRHLYEQLLLANKSNKSRHGAFPKNDEESQENKKLRSNERIKGHLFVW